MVTPQVAHKGTKWFIGAPANPIPPAQVEAIVSLLRRVGGIREAHLPQCYAEGVTPEAAQVLFLVLEPSTDVQATMHAIGQGLASGILPTGKFLDMMPLSESDAMLTPVREANMQILGQPSAPPKKSFFQRLFGQ